MAAVFLEDPLAAIQSLPVEAIEADGIVQPAVIALHHVAEEIGLVLGLVPLACPGGSGC